MRRTRDVGGREPAEETLTLCTGDCGASVPWGNEMCDSCLDAVRDAGDGRSA